MKPSIREALDRLYLEVQSDKGQRDLALVEEELILVVAELTILVSQLSEQDEAIAALMLQVEHLREMVPQ